MREKEIFSLGSLGTLTSSKRIFKKEYVKEGIPFYRSKEIKELAHNKEISLELFITEERYIEIKDKFGIPKKGDILLTAVGTIGEMYIVEENDEFYFKDGNIMWLKDFESLDSYYLKYQLTLFIENIKSLAQGTAYSALTIEKLKKYEILVPPLKEQKQIVTTLDKAFKQINQAKVNLEKNLNNAKELFQSKLNEVFSQRGEGWEEKRLGEACILTMGQSPKGTTYNSDGIGMPLINGPVEFGKNPFSKTVKTKFTTDPKKLCKKNDLILCVRGSTTGKINIAGFEACIGRGVASIRFEENQKWLNFFIRANQNYIYSLGTGSTFPNVSGAILSKILFPIPPLNEQLVLVETMEALLENTDKLIVYYQQKLNNLEELKKSILQKAFKGELAYQ